MAYTNFTYGPTSYAKDPNGTVISYNSTKVYEIRLGYAYDTDQNITENKTSVKLQLEVRSVNSQYKTYGYNQTTTIDGTTYGAKTFDFRSTNTWQIFGTKTFEVTHNDDGTYSVSKSASFTTNVSGSGRPKSGSASVTVNLPTIPRASSFTISKTSGGSAASSFNLGETLYVNISRASSSFTHNVYWKVGSSSNQTISSSAGTSANTTLALNMANYIPSTSGTATIYVDTYNGGTLIGSASQTFTLNVPSSVVPTISSVTKSDTAGYLSTYGAYVQGKSNLRIQTSASGAYGSSISSYTVKLKSGNTVLATKTGSNVTFANISYTGSLTVEVTVVDSRSRSATNTSTITVATYSNPNIAYLTAERNGTTPSTVKLTFSASITNINSSGANGKTFKLQKRKKGDTSWTDLQTYTSSYTYSNNNYTTTCDENYGWEFRLTAQDSFTSTTYTTDVGTVFELINYGSNGTSIAFGKVAEQSNSFECDLDPYFKKIKMYDSTNSQWVDLEVEVVDTW